jgi:hypothetical protein
VSTEEFTDGHIVGHIIIDSALGLALADTRTPPEQEKGGVSGALVGLPLRPPESSGHFSATLALHAPDSSATRDTIEHRRALAATQNYILAMERLGIVTCVTFIAFG